MCSFCLFRAIAARLLLRGVLAILIAAMPLHGMIACEITMTNRAQALAHAAQPHGEPINAVQFGKTKDLAVKNHGSDTSQMTDSCGMVCHSAFTDTLVTDSGIYLRSDALKFEFLDVAAKSVEPDTARGPPLILVLN